MSISGNLKTMELSELLQWLSSSQKTGTLVVDSGEVHKQIHFKTGKVIATSSTDPSEYLGHFLVSLGYITEFELTKAIEMQEETGMLIGKILVTIGGLTEEELTRLLVMKAEESIYDMFAWDEGEFRFMEGATIERGIIPLKLDVTGLTLHGMNRVDEWQRIREIIPHDGAIPVLVSMPDREELNPTRLRVLESIDHSRTVREICLETHSSEFHVSQIVFQEQEAGRIKVVVPRFQPAGDESTDSNRDVSAESLLATATLAIEAGKFDKGLRYLRAARSLEPDNNAVQRSFTNGQKKILEAVRKAGLEPTSIPMLERSMDELTALQLTPQEGFLLSRVDGSHSVEALIKICPLDAVEAQLVFFKMMKEGHFSLRKT